MTKEKRRQLIAEAYELLTSVTGPLDRVASNLSFLKEEQWCKEARDIYKQVIDLHISIRHRFENNVPKLEEELKK